MSRAEAPCQTPAGAGAACDLWPDGVDADLYNALVRQVRDYPGGVQLTYLAEAIYGPDSVYKTVSGTQRPTAEYQRVRRAVHDLADREVLRTEKRPDYRIEDGTTVKTDRQNAPLWVYPEWIPPVLKSSRHTSAEGAASGPDPQRAAGSLPAGAPGGRAAGTARSVLRDRCSITPGSRGARVRAALRHALAAHRKGVDSEGMRDDRVSSAGRVAARQGAFLGAFEAAARRHREGVVLTLTARPGESGDMVDTAVAVNESVDPLRDHLRRQTPGDARPPAIVVREATERGVLHLHVVVFGVGPADIGREALARYWHETRGHGYIIDVAAVERRPARTGDGQRHRWVFGDHPDAPTERGRYVRSYLGEMLFRLRGVAEASPEELHRGDVPEAWKVAVLWATGLPVVSVSAGLRSADAGRPRPRRPSESPGRVGPRRVEAGRVERVAALPSRTPVGGRGKPPPPRETAGVNALGGAARSGVFRPPEGSFAVSNPGCACSDRGVVGRAPNRQVRNRFPCQCLQRSYAG